MRKTLTAVLACLLTSSMWADEFKKPNILFIAIDDMNDWTGFLANDPDEWTNLAKNPKHAAVKKRLAAHLPEREVPIVMEGLEGWSIPYSADKPLGRELNNKAGSKAKKKKKK